MSKIIVRIKGGLGNQLFCYAAARRLALVNSAELVIDNVSGFIRDRKYQRKYALDNFFISVHKATLWDRLEPFERYRRAIAKLVARKRDYELRKYIEQDGLDFDPRLLDFRPIGTVYLDGLWQSEGYFKDVENIIRQDLRIKPPSDVTNLEMAMTITACNAICVHVRWFKNPTEMDIESGHNLTHEYYRKAINEISSRVKFPHFFIFSDYPDAALDMLALPEGTATCVHHNLGDENAYADLWLMSKCKHFIIANSTFSWWGAWLADSLPKIVLTPEFNLSDLSAWGFSGQIPNGWIKVKS
jgi:hypothetical protein